MQTKDITKLLNIPRERIKYYKKKQVFAPELEAERGKTGEFTERDISNLKRLEVLTKAGLTCDDIKKVQIGSITLSEAFEGRKKTNLEIIAQKQGAVALSSLLMREGADYLAIEHYWESVHQREREGEQFDEPELENQTIALDRLVKCPVCGKYQEIDFEDYIVDNVSNPSSREDDMGEDIVYTFDSENSLKCSHCGRRFRVRGWIREYPVGAYDSESIEVTVNEEESDE